MIELINIQKEINQVKMLDNLSFKIPNACIFGVLTDNKQSASTLLRLISGCITANSGYLYIDGQPVFDNLNIKENIFLVASDPFFIHNTTIKDMRAYYRLFYPDFDEEIFTKLLKLFNLKKNTRIDYLTLATRKQAALSFALALRAKYLLIDDLFFCISEAQKLVIIEIFKNNVEEFGQTIIISSTLATELNNLCDGFVLINKNKLILEHTNQEAINNLFKVQIIFANNQQIDLSELNIISENLEGIVCTLLINSDKEKIIKFLEKIKPLKYSFINPNLSEISQFYLGVNHEI
ncbi:MAG: ATP-binding cassette domain-containing protein [Erysipelotrichaceae bacterium]